MLDRTRSTERTIIIGRPLEALATVGRFILASLRQAPQFAVDCIFTHPPNGVRALVAAREQIYVLLRHAKWMIAVSLLLALALGAPAQVKELYRIVYSDSMTASNYLLKVCYYLSLHVPILLVGLIVWFGTNQIVTETRASIEHPKPGFVFCAQMLPAVLCALPLAGSAFGLYEAIPVLVVRPGDPVGGEWDQYRAILSSIRVRLQIGALIQVVTLLVLMSQWRNACWILKETANRLNQRYLGHWRGIAVMLILISLITAAFVRWPVALPHFIGPFVIIVLFSICLVGAVVNLSLIGTRYRAPVISTLGLIAIVFSLSDWTDNHAVRTIGTPIEELKRDSDRKVSQQFKEWLALRPNRDKYDEYPVYIVAAQGGGIYAAYQTAIFLARMQDVCPAFREHVFAISGVSGGSVGAAMFIAALRALDDGILEPKPDISKTSPNTFDPCPATTVPVLETAVHKGLEKDFLSPLAAAALFPDFMQRFLFFRVGPFDRARALEYTFEAAGRSFVRSGERSAFESGVHRLWDAKAEKSTPALLINTTDAGSGRRFLIAPFKLVDRPTIPVLPHGPLVDFQFWEPNTDKGQDLRLSTALGIGARFPWVTPAATVEHSGMPTAIKDSKKVKLVDGGYVDNSGVETVLEIKRDLDRIIDENNRVVGSKKVNLNLIVLSGGDFPLRKSFALGETMEPVRALLNTRASRAHVAIGRAPESFPSTLLKSVLQAGERYEIHRPTLRLALLQNYFYELPLGWRLSEQTRKIIAQQSGQRSNCNPSEKFLQAPGFAPADCVQFLIYHDLSQSVQAAADDIAHTLTQARGQRRDIDDPLGEHDQR